MDIIIELFLTFLVGVISSVIGAIAGGGGLISIPFLMFLGFSAPVAIATNKMGSVGLSGAAMYRFWKAEKILWKYVLPFSILAIGGGLIGSYILTLLEARAVERIVGLILILLIPTLFISKDFGIVRKEKSFFSISAGYLIYFLLMIFAGFFGGGAGTLIFFCLMSCMGFTIIEANATDIIPWFLLAVSSLIYFMFHGLVRYDIGISLFLGMTVGGYIGAHLAVKKGNAWVKLIFAIVIIASAINILFL